MSRRLIQAAVALLVVFVAAQFVRPPRANPPDSNRTIQAQMGTATGLAAVLERACGDCHSNKTAWPWYTQIAPVSWVVARGVAEGRRAVNFSEWATYPPEQQRQLLITSCRDASQGTMPMPAYTRIRPEARLSPQDLETICSAAEEAGRR